MCKKGRILTRSLYLNVLQLEGRAKNCQWQCKQQIKFLLSKPSYLCLGRTVCMQRDYLTWAMQSLPSKRVSSQHPNRYFASLGQYAGLGLWLMQNKTSCLSFPSCFTGTINKVISISLHSMKTFLPHLLEDHRERIENSEGNKVKMQWESTDVVQMLQVLVTCLSLGKHEGMKWFWWQSCHSSPCWQQPALQLVLLFWGGLKVQYVLWIHT